MSTCNGIRIAEKPVAFGMWMSHRTFLTGAKPEAYLGNLVECTRTHLTGLIEAAAIALIPDGLFLDHHFIKLRAAIFIDEHWN